MGGEHDTYSRAEFYCSTKRTADFANKSVHRTSQRGLYAVEPTNICLLTLQHEYALSLAVVFAPKKNIRTCLGMQQTNSTISHLGPDFPGLHKGGVFFFRFSLWKSEIWGQQWLTMLGNRGIWNPCSILSYFWEFVTRTKTALFHRNWGYNCEVEAGGFRKALWCFWSFG